MTARTLCGKAAIAKCLRQCGQRSCMDRGKAFAGPTELRAIPAFSVKRDGEDILGIVMRGYIALELRPGSVEEER